MRRVIILMVILALAGFFVAPVFAQDFNLENPVKNVNDLDDLISAIADNLITIAIPIATLMYIYGGILYMTAGGNPQRVSRATSILLWTSVGLAIVLIGTGFISLIQSILELG